MKQPFHWNRLIEDACEAEEIFGVDELERYTMAHHDMMAALRKEESTPEYKRKMDEADRILNEAIAQAREKVGKIKLAELLHSKSIGAAHDALL